MKLANLMAWGFVAGLVICFSGLAEAQESPAKFGEGHHFGVDFRIAALGTAKATTEIDDPIGSGTIENDDYPSMASSFGFELFWEYVLPGGMFAPGAGFRMHFHNAEFDADIPRSELFTEMQFDPRMRVYLAPNAWLRPYVQAALGFSLGVPNKQSDDVFDALFGFNASGSFGFLVVPKGSHAAFFVDAGIEGLFYGAAESDDLDDTQLSGHIRQMIISFGMLI